MTRVLLNRIEWLLRIGVFLTFIGHGFFAISGKTQWLPYLSVFGFSKIIAFKLLFFIGVIDVIIAFSILFKPFRYVLLWAALWAFSAALMRPIVGEPLWDFVERGSNWIAPLTLFFLLDYKKKKLY